MQGISVINIDLRHKLSYIPFEPHIVDTLLCVDSNHTNTSTIPNKVKVHWIENSSSNFHLQPWMPHNDNMY